MKNYPWPTFGLSIFASLLVLTFSQPSLADEAFVYDVPRLSSIRVDGQSNDWGGKGFRVEMMASPEHRVSPLADFEPIFRLGWDTRGLLVLISIKDDTFIESDDENVLWNGDSIEIYVAAEQGSRDAYELVIAPGVVKAQGNVRVRSYDMRKGTPRTEIPTEFARLIEPGGYTLEILLPWSNLNSVPGQGDEVAFQLVANDADPEQNRFQATWFPNAKTRNDPNSMHRIRLSSSAERPVRTHVWGEYDEFARGHVGVIAPAEDAGSRVVAEGGGLRARGTLVSEGDFAQGDLYFPLPEPDHRVDTLRVKIGGQKAGDIGLPDSDIVRAQRVMFLPVIARPPVFKGSNLPACEVENPLVAERLIGHYRTRTTYFDENFNEVESAASPGRYGAVVEIDSDWAGVVRRYITLYRAPDAYDPVVHWWFLDPKASVRLPASLGYSDNSLAAQEDAIGRMIKQGLTDGLAKDQSAAVFFAGLDETPDDAGTKRMANDFWATDRQWWVELKRRQNGMAERYPYTFVCPYQKEGEPAPILRVGTASEAGMKPDAVHNIDAVCRAWAEESGEPFAVCLARHGVVFFHQAYGNRDGAPMTTTTKSWMASISKFLSGTLMMELVDQGYVDLDAPIDQYLPSFRGIPVERPLTIRSLFTHTNGLQLGLQPPRMYVDHWGDDMNDLEELIAGYYPHLDVGTRHGYNGVGYAIAGKIIESVTGEALPQFFYNHFWHPLGAEDTDAVDMSARTMSVPLDIAKVGQMLLNRGAYGNMRFFRDETFEKLLPISLSPFVAFETDLQWGIGCVWMPEGGALSPKTFGHGAASAATFRIDPENDLVVVMTRNTAGPQWGKYHPQFIQAVADGLDRDVK